MPKGIKDTIEAKGFAIQIYTEDFKNEYISLTDIARYKRTLIDVPVVAITGSVGKTSTKDTISSVLSSKFRVLKTEGNLNNEIGVPFTILRYTDEDVIVVEMGMNGFGQISVLTNIAKPTIVVITNIGTAHIGILGSRDNILKAKMEILEGLQSNVVIINNDNDLLHNWFFENSKKYDVITYGISEKSKYVAEKIIIKDKNIEKYAHLLLTISLHFSFLKLALFSKFPFTFKLL